eukprot:scaffold117011_cov36-Phaeocystis_antarctica.AAC.1
MRTSPSPPHPSGTPGYVTPTPLPPPGGTAGGTGTAAGTAGGTSLTALTALTMAHLDRSAAAAADDQAR